jgi:hypothetical protein
MFDFVARLSRVWNRPTPQRRAAPRSRQGFVPRLEALEDRMTPAGVVNTTFASGLLTVTCLDSPTPNLNNQVLTLTRTGDNTYKLSAGDGETINGVMATEVSKSGILSVKFVMGRGNDQVTLLDPELNTGTLTFQGGDGDNTLNINANGGLSKIATLSITNGDGLDRLNVGNGGNNFNKVTINNGIGDSETFFGAPGTDTTDIAGTLAIINGDGDDTFFAGGNSFTVNGATSIRNNVGGSDTQFNATTTEFKSTLSIFNLAGFDELEFAGDTALLRSVIISNGNDGSATIFGAETTTINGTLSVTSADGTDNFQTTGNNFTVEVPGTGIGSVTISTGNGGGTTIFDSADDSQFSIDGRLTITGLAGNDQIQIERLSVGSLTNINTGSGNDRIDIDASTFNGSVTINTGAGNDVINIEFEDIFDGTNDDTFFNGSVTVLAGSGDDFLTIGLDGDNFGVFTKAPVKFDGGTGLDTFDRTFYAGVPLTTLNTINWETIIPPLP